MPPHHSLEQALRAAVRGDVRFSPGDRALYATDASNYRVPPIGVVLPRDADDVVAAVAVARAHDAPILGRGAGTSLAGQACNRAVVLDFSRHMDGILELDPDAAWARVQPGVILDDLRDAAAPHGLTFGPDPATHDRCTLGGMIGNNACGAHSVLADLYGPGPLTEHQVLELTVLTYDGHVLTVGPTPDDVLAARIAGGGPEARIYRSLKELRDRYGDAIRARYPDIPRRVSGYNLPALLPENGFDVARALVGTESTCAIVLEARVRLIPARAGRALLVVGFRDVFEAADRVPALMAHRPVALEGVDDTLTGYMRRKGLHAAELAGLPAGGAWLFVEFGAEAPAAAAAAARGLMAELEASPAPPAGMTLYTEPEAMARLWNVRESGLGATAFVPGSKPAWPGWEDAAVPPARVGDYLREFRALLDRYGYDAAIYGHFGQGCLHSRIDFDLSSRAGVARYMAFIDDAAALVVRYGGSLSGEHGDGRSRAHLLPRMFGDELVDAFRTFKGIWDPAGRMNPGRVVDPDPADGDLRMGPDYRPARPALPARPARPATRFAFSADGGSFAAAADRCVGVGVCRRTDGGTMCPSYMVTREERHGTRGRARLLQEMVRGEVVTDGWRSEEVKEALDLCLSCKGCKSDCPVDVDIATYKAEFLSHYYEGRVRPRAAYAMGMIHRWARWAALAPRAVNGLARAPGIGRVVKWAAGVHPDRALPAFAPTTFRARFRRRARPTGGGRRVILWPDTFTNYFAPEVGDAAIEVLEALGFRPVLPAGPVCCGRPLFDHGFLDRARRRLRAAVATLRDEVRAGTPVVGLEPSCVAVFRDELPDLLPDDDDARRLAESAVLLTELLDARDDLDLGRLTGTAIVHGHCHHRAVLDFPAQQRVLDRLGVTHTVLDTGCCGMAGAFGFTARHYDLAQACAERALLPAVRRADPDTMVLTDGFSCRQMLLQNGLARPLHSAELLRTALGAGS